MSVGEFGAFPSLRKPRVLWVGVQAPEQLQILQKGIEDQTPRLGYAREDRPFSPHLTLARMARTASPDEIRRTGEAIKDFEVSFLGAMRVEEIHLFQSELQKGGPIYTQLYSGRLQ